MIDKDLEERMHLAQTVTSMVLALRRKAEIKVRQPLQKILVPAVDESQCKALEAMRQLILGEVNVKDLEIVGDDDQSILVKKVKPDFKKLGPKFGKQMKQVAAAIQGLDQHEISRLEREGAISLMIEGEEAHIDVADVEIISEDIPGWLVANEGNVTVALDITVTPELRQEGVAREIVNRIQNIRKSRDYQITDRINLTFAPCQLTDDAIKNYADYVARQVLADTLLVGPVTDDDMTEILDIDGTDVKVRITLSK